MTNYIFLDAKMGTLQAGGWWMYRMVFYVANSVLIIYKNNLIVRHGFHVNLLDWISFL